MQVKKQQNQTWKNELVENWERSYVKALYCYPAYLTSMQNSVQLLSRVTLCDPMDCSTPGFPVHHQLPKFTQTHVHWEKTMVTHSSTLALKIPWTEEPGRLQSRGS